MWEFVLIRDRLVEFDGGVLRLKRVLLVVVVRQIPCCRSRRIPCRVPLDCQLLLVCVGSFLDGGSLWLLIFPCCRSRWGRLCESGLVVLYPLFVILHQDVWLLSMLVLLVVVLIPLFVWVLLVV